MADEVKLESPFPAPPPFWKNFTASNLKQLRELRKGAARSQDTEDFDILSLPAELRVLIPPSPPEDGKYRSFGASCDRFNTASEDTIPIDDSIERLISETDESARQNPQAHLLALSRSLLTTFLALTGVLATNPELQAQKTKDLRSICWEVQRLINAYRPHQARETLILMMEERIESVRAEIRRVEEVKGNLREALAGLQEQGQSAAEEGASERTLVRKEGMRNQDTEDTRKQRQRAAWVRLEEEMHDAMSSG